ncbi:MAG: hypothetical protein BGO31_16635 [Bacteroidetes bacterium 43-16]|nr:MAG: hypothetical protein BGO31_16635 [Bacteroidetes bacterium 43-16]
MNIIKSIVVALALSGTAAVIPHVAMAQTVALEKVSKNDLLAVQKVYNKEKDNASNFERFRVLMQKAIAVQKNNLLESGEAPEQTAKYEKLVDAFNKVILANRTNNKVEVNKAMTGFINVM